MSVAAEMMDSIRMRTQLDDFAKAWAKKGTTEAEREARLDTLLSAVGSYLMTSEAPAPVQTKAVRIAEERAKLTRLDAVELDDDALHFTPEQARREDELDRKAKAEQTPEPVVRELVFRECIQGKKRTASDGLPCVVLPRQYKGHDVPIQGWAEFFEAKGFHYGSVEMEVEPHGRTFVLKFT